MAIRKGVGTVLQVGDGASPTEGFTTIAQRVEITGPGITVEKVDTTTLDDSIMKCRPGLPDPGELKLKLFYDPADTTHTNLTTLVLAPVVHNMKLNFAGGNTWAFKGYISSFEPNGMTVKDNLGADVGLQVTDTITPS